jgi:hypothetical protein
MNYKKRNIYGNHVKNFTDNFLAEKGLILLGSGAPPAAIQRRNAGRQSRNNL